jgi:hypothetical protein
MGRIQTHGHTQMQRKKQIQWQGERKNSYRQSTSQNKTSLEEEIDTLGLDLLGSFLCSAFHRCDAC